MEELKHIIAKNITDLRRKRNITQLELAEKLCYSDKAVSKWERGESVPDIAVLKHLADLFGVTVDYLLTTDHKKPAPVPEVKQRSPRRRGVITWLAVLLVWMIATLAFVTAELIAANPLRHSLLFLWSIPVSAVVWLVMNSIWFNRRRNYPIISCLMWSVLAATHLTLLQLGFNMWLIYLLGAPAQIIIFLWSGVSIRRE